jgi:hypothetical protein
VVGWRLSHQWPQRDKVEDKVEEAVGNWSELVDTRLQVVSARRGWWMMVGGSWFYCGWWLMLSDSAVLDRKCLMDNAGPKNKLKKAQKERRNSAEMVSVEIVAAIVTDCARNGRCTRPAGRQVGSRESGDKSPHSTS